MPKRRKSAKPADPTSGTVLKIGSRMITVFPATFVMDIRCQILRTEIHKTPSSTLEEQVARFNFYAPMVSCSSGDLPTEEEFLAMPSVQVNEWYQACLAKNPTMFDIQAMPDDEEKKSN